MVSDSRGFGGEEFEKLVGGLSDLPSFPEVGSTEAEILKQIELDNALSTDFVALVTLDVPGYDLELHGSIYEPPRSLTPPDQADLEVINNTRVIENQEFLTLADYEAYYHQETRKRSIYAPRILMDGSRMTIIRSQGRFGTYQVYDEASYQSLIKNFITDSIGSTLATLERMGLQPELLSVHCGNMSDIPCDLLDSPEIIATLPDWAPDYTALGKQVAQAFFEETE